MSRTNRILLAVVVVAGAICGFYFLALAPKREEIAKLDADIAAVQAEVDSARDTLAAHERARASYPRTYALLARLGKAVPADDDVRSLLVQIESAAERSGVDFQKIEVGTGASVGTTQPATEAGDELAPAPGSVPVAGGALSAMPFSFTFNGSYFELSEFLARLERFVTVTNRRIDATGRLLRLESVEIQPGAAGFPAMQAEVGAATYLVPPPEAVEGAPEPSAGTPAAPSNSGGNSATTTATVTGGAP
jgi:Tfp pilus assembly protein PilO